MKTAEKNLQKRIRDFWHELPIGPDVRLAAVTEFTAQLETEGIDLMRQEVQHPDFYGKNKAPRSAIAEIMADALFRGGNNAQKSVEYPAYTTRYSDDKERERKFSRRSDNRPAVEFSLYDRAPGEERQPSGTITLQNASLRAMMPEPDDVDRADMIEAIGRLQADIEKHAGRIARQYCKTAAEVRAALRGMKPENVKDCVICCAAFYAVDARTEVCGDKCGRERDRLRKKLKKAS
ncbi:hypothetical protein [Bhargavaea beijingensis]|uniref:hypothetical protein n=1 Tax=Bhargavaea beijingensis TaxID=426756 RepID=UPI0022250A6E|nr:hypothetical protein [Bhargavaea beijingensis]MCW1926952.1 hypothetical protein [Bhargavaea beijingensis]